MTAAALPATRPNSRTAPIVKTVGSKVLVAMSGGVDSSAAALLLREQGYDCAGCTMKLYDNAGAGLSQHRICCSLEDVEDARAAAFRLGIPHYVFNFQEEFRKAVMEKFAGSYENGLTPNPCIDCNRSLKFGRLLERARVLGCDYLATGHYARIEERDGRYLLKKALDESKDRSYFLYAMTQDQLARTLFPLGELRKAEVRRLAEERGLSNARKPDSQDICFVPDGDCAAAVERISGRSSVPGNFVDASGNGLGTHRGVIHYTVGQRRGLGVSAPERLYVRAISVKDNTVLLGGKAALFRRWTGVGEFHWISGEAPDRPFCCGVKLRSTQRELPVTVFPAGKDRVCVVFDEPQPAPAPGQAAAFSGSADSTFLLKTAYDMLGNHVIAVTASSCSFPQREPQEAQTFCRENGIRHRELKFRR